MHRSAELMVFFSSIPVFLGFRRDLIVIPPKFSFLGTFIPRPPRHQCSSAVSPSLLLPSSVANVSVSLLLYCAALPPSVPSPPCPHGFSRRPSTARQKRTKKSRKRNPSH